MDKQDYIKIKNVVINDLHITRDDVITMMNNHVEKILKGEIENLLRSDWFTKLLDITLFRIMKDGIEDGVNYFCAPVRLKDYIKSEIKRAVKEQILAKYEIEIKEKE